MEEREGKGSRCDGKGREVDMIGRMEEGREGGREVERL